MKERESVFETALRLERAGEPFVLAVVIRAEKPTSAKAGAKAVVTGDGRWFGWIGGSCSQPAVEAEARLALASDRPRVLVLSSSETCASGGSLEIYLEPHVPKPNLVIVGHHPVAEALASMGRPLGFAVTVMTPEGSAESFPDADRFFDRVDFGEVGGGERYVVVASHGNYDVDGVRAALASPKVAYVGLVASRKRGEALVSGLDLTDEQRERLEYPAGLDIGAQTPEEIALSILAAIVSRRRAKTKAEVAEAPRMAKDPVCGMNVAIDNARYTLVSGAETIYFCGPGCKERYAHDH